MRHERVKLDSGLGFPRYTACGFFISLGLLVCMLAFSFPMQQYFWGVAVLLALPLFFGSQIDKRSFVSTDTQRLQGMGYIEQPTFELSDELKYAVSLLHPKGSKPKHIKRCLRGMSQDLEVVIMHIERDKNDGTERYSACAVWSPLILPQIVIKRKGLFGQAKIDLKKNTHQLGDHHVLVTESQDAVCLMNNLSDWFRLKNPEPRSFRLEQPQGLKESWVITGNWVLYADLGTASSRTFDQLAHFTTSFVIELEQTAASAEQVPLIQE